MRKNREILGGRDFRCTNQTKELSDAACSSGRQREEEGKKERESGLADLQVKRTPLRVFLSIIYIPIYIFARERGP